MHYLFCKHRVADFATWRAIFDSHAEAQRKSGLHILHVLRDTTDPNLVVLFFRVDDPAKARAFTQSPKASESAEIFGVIGVPELLLLEE